MIIKFITLGEILFPNSINKYEVDEKLFESIIKVFNRDFTLKSIDLAVFDYEGLESIIISHLNLASTGQNPFSNVIINLENSNHVKLKVYNIFRYNDSLYVDALNVGAEKYDENLFSLRPVFVGNLSSQYGIEFMPCMGVYPKIEKN